MMWCVAPPFNISTIINIIVVILKSGVSLPFLDGSLEDGGSGQ